MLGYVHDGSYCSDILIFCKKSADFWKNVCTFRSIHWGQYLLFQNFKDTNKYADEVRNDIYEAQQAGICGVPFLMFNNKFAIQFQ